MEYDRFFGADSDAIRNALIRVDAGRHRRDVQSTRHPKQPFFSTVGGSEPLAPYLTIG
jgi:hypothetical protein